MPLFSTAAIIGGLLSTSKICLMSITSNLLKTLDLPLTLPVSRLRLLVLFRWNFDLLREEIRFFLYLPMGTVKGSYLKPN
jgi:hypothetical protein